MLPICSICSDSLQIERNTKVVTTVCGHLYHYECINEWYKKSKTCPQCRQSCFKVSPLFFNYALNDSNEELNVALKHQLKNLETQLIQAKADNETLKRKCEDLEEKLKKRDDSSANLKKSEKVLKIKTVPKKSKNAEVVNKIGMRLRSGKIVK